MDNGRERRPACPGAGGPDNEGKGSRGYDLGVWKLAFTVRRGDDVEYDAVLAATGSIRGERLRAVREEIAALPH